jgi:hypothetical protein
MITTEFKIKTNDIELLAKAVNNALICYGDIITSLSLGCTPGLRRKVTEKLEEIPEEELRNRVKALEDLYNQIITVERWCYKDERISVEPGD